MSLATAQQRFVHGANWGKHIPKWKSTSSSSASPVARADLNRRPTVHPAAGRQQKKTKQTEHLNFFKTQWVLARVAPDRAVPDRVAPAFTFSRRAALDRATPPIRFAFASVRSVRMANPGAAFCSTQSFSSYGRKSRPPLAPQTG